jgi:hypothetical protein
VTRAGEEWEGEVMKERVREEVEKVGMGRAEEAGERERAAAAVAAAAHTSGIPLRG